MMISLSFKMDFDDFLDFFRRISLCSLGLAQPSGLAPKYSRERLYFGA